MKKIIVVVTIFCMLMSNLSFALSPSLMLDDLDDAKHHKLIALAEMRLQMEFKLIDESGNTTIEQVGSHGLPIILKGWKGRQVYGELMPEKVAWEEDTIFNPAQITLFMQNVTPVAGNIYRIPVRVEKNGEGEQYHLFFSTQKKDGAYPVVGCTTEDLEAKEAEIKAAALEDILPQRQAKDAEAINRYIQHEEGVDAVIRYAHKNGLAKKPVRFISFKDIAVKLPSELKVRIANPDGLTPIQNREFFLIKMTDELRKMKDELPKAKVIDKNGKEHEISYFAHSSNTGIHIFVDEASFEMFTDPEFREIGMDQTAKHFALLDVHTKIVHEIGVILGMDILEIDAQHKVAQAANHMDERWAERKNMTEDSPWLEAKIVDLDKNLLTRDYAAGESGEKSQEELRAELVKLAERAGLGRAKDAQAAFDATLAQITSRNILTGLLAIFQATAVRNKKYGTLADKVLARVRSLNAAKQPRDAAGRVVDSPGKNPEDARKIIALSELLRTKPFTASQYVKEYARVVKEYGYLNLGFDPTISESTARRDLLALKVRGSLDINPGKGRFHYHTLTLPAQGAMVTLREEIFRDELTKLLIACFMESGADLTSLSLVDEDSPRAIASEVSWTLRYYFNKVVTNLLKEGALPTEKGLDNMVPLLNRFVEHGDPVGNAEISQEMNSRIRKWAIGIARVTMQDSESKLFAALQAEQGRESRITDMTLLRMTYDGEKLEEIEGDAIKRFYGESVDFITSTKFLDEAIIHAGVDLKKTALSTAISAKRRSRPSGIFPSAAMVNGNRQRAAVREESKGGRKKRNWGRKGKRSAAKEIRRRRRNRSRGREKPGRSPEDALVIIAWSGILERGMFTLRKYHESYDKVRTEYPGLLLSQLPKNPETTSRKDLEALVERGILEIMEGPDGYIYKVTRVVGLETIKVFNSFVGIMAEATQKSAGEVAALCMRGGQGFEISDIGVTGIKLSKALRVMVDRFKDGILFSGVLADAESAIPFGVRIRFSKKDSRSERVIDITDIEGDDGVFSVVNNRNPIVTDVLVYSHGIEGIKRFAEYVSDEDIVCPDVAPSQQDALTEEALAAAFQQERVAVEAFDAGNVLAAAIEDAGIIELLEEAIELLPVEYEEHGLRKQALLARLAGIVGHGMSLRENSAMIFSEKVTFDNGLGVLLPKLTQSGIKVAVVATNDRQKKLINELNQGKPENQKIVCADSVAEITANLNAVKYYYFKVDGDPDANMRAVSEFNITQKVKQIIEALGQACDVSIELIGKLHEAARKFAEAA